MNASAIYYPIIKWKQGEQHALKELSPEIRSKVIPIIEFIPRKFDFNSNSYKKSFPQHISDLTSKLVSTSFESFYLDTELVESNYIDDIHIYDYISQENDKFIPVVRYPSKFDYKYFTDNDFLHEELALRLIVSDISKLSTTLNLFLKDLNFADNLIVNKDLIIDLEYFQPEHQTDILMELQKQLSNLSVISSFRKVIICGTTIPSSFKDFEKYKAISINRSIDTIWYQLRINLKNVKLNYGDYCISNPRLPDDIDPSKISVSTNIRYSVNDRHYFFKGDLYKKNPSHQKLAQLIVDLPGLFYGNDYSQGDSDIYQGSKNLLKGTPTTWRKVGTNHHITLVVNQLSNLFDI